MSSFLLLLCADLDDVWDVDEIFWNHPLTFEVEGRDGLALGLVRGGGSADVVFCRPVGEGDDFVCAD